VDLCDDRGYARLVRDRDTELRARGLTAAYGCSTLPGISGALALALREAVGGASLERVQVTLFIGNDNPKGLAAVRSLVGNIGRPIRAPQGTLRQLRDGARVSLPPPFGPRLCFETPDYDLLAPLVGATSIEVFVVFELRAVMAAFSLLGRLPLHYGERSARLLARAGAMAPGFGGSGGAIQVEGWLSDGRSVRASAVSVTEGQRMAALPCAAAAECLVRGRPASGGARVAYDLLGAGPLLDRLAVEGCSIVVRPTAA
jgi:hypothetical protein